MAFGVFIGYFVSETCLLQKNGSILARNPQRGYFGMREGYFGFWSYIGEGLFWISLNLKIYCRGAILEWVEGYFGEGLFWMGSH